MLFERTGSTDYLEEAIANYESVVNTAEESEGDELWISEAMNSLGGACIYKGEYRRARDIFEQMSMSINVASDSSKGTTCTWDIENNVGITYLHQGRYDIAMTYFRSALEAMEHALGEHSIDTALVRINFGDAYLCKDNLEMGTKYFREASELLQNPQEREGIILVTRLCHSRFPEFLEDEQRFLETYPLVKTVPRFSDTVSSGLVYSQPEQRDEPQTLVYPEERTFSLAVPKMRLEGESPSFSANSFPPETGNELPSGKLQTEANDDHSPAMEKSPKPTEASLRDEDVPAPDSEVPVYTSKPVDPQDDSQLVPLLQGSQSFALQGIVEERETGGTSCSAVLSVIGELVVGIEFGIRSTGVAYSLKRIPFGSADGVIPDYQMTDQIFVIKAWPGHLSEKVPSVLSYNTTPPTWGNDFKLRSAKFAVISNFLLALEPAARQVYGLAFDTEGSEFGKKTPVDVAADYLRCIYQFIHNVFFPSTFGHYFMGTRVLSYVISIPAIWSDLAKANTRLAAERAGFPGHRLTLISEMDAAAIFCSTTCDGVDLNDSDRFLVCDAGGRLVVSVYLILSEFRNSNVTRLCRESHSQWRNVP
jgi:tetratricopeptide (TPR) repeat protein